MPFIVAIMDYPSKTEIYLDYAASTPCDPLVVEAMMPYLLHEFANPASPHRAGARARQAVEEAREKIADAIGCRPSDLAFTAGATESNNIALLGAAETNASNRRKIITTPIEHKSVLGPCERLASRGYELCQCAVRGDGRIDIGALAEQIDERTFAVSVQAANNEIGTTQPISEIVQLAHQKGAIVHCDAAQAFGKIQFDVGLSEVDLASLSGHKCYGPKGVGALYIRGGIASGRLGPVTFGGGQEGGLRSGTANVPGIVGFGEAGRLNAAALECEVRRVGSLRDYFEGRLLAETPDARRNGSRDCRIPGITSITIYGIDAESVIANCPELSLSSSSACHAGAPEPSHVLRAIGLSREEAYSTIRIGIGRFTTKQDLDYAAKRISDLVGDLRDLMRRPSAVGCGPVEPRLASEPG